MNEMKKKIEIITIVDETNYGNRLQNYALSKLMGAYAPDICTVKYSEPANNSLQKNIMKLRDLRNYLRKCYARLKTMHPFLIEKKIKAFKNFSRRYLSFISYDSASAIKNSINVVCVLGSDQIWNYHWFSNFYLSAQLGAYVPPESCVISYAASFGVSQIEDEEARALFQKYLPKLKAISVREHRGAELVEKIAGLKATVVLDPTLMLSKDMWLEITEGFVADGDKYVLTYFLGHPSDEQEHDIQTYAKAHGCRVRRMLDLRDEETYVAGPQDFVELFSKAQYVFTDSYHACCFSIMFHKQFTVFNRSGMAGKSNMNSRMETLFRLFALDSVMMDSGIAPKIDYSKVDQLLERHRKESQDWLDKVMEE